MQSLIRGCMITQLFSKTQEALCAVQRGLGVVGGEISEARQAVVQRVTDGV